MPAGGSRPALGCRLRLDLAFAAACCFHRFTSVGRRRALLLDRIPGHQGACGVGRARGRRRDETRRGMPGMLAARMPTAAVQRRADLMQPGGEAV